MVYDLSITLMTDQDIEPYGLYQINPGCTQIFPVQIPSLGSLKLTTNHLFTNSQDWSISWWITTEPLDDIVLSPGYGHFRMIREEEVFEIFDKALEIEDDERLLLPSNQSYFINVKNLQNSLNGYQLLIEPQNGNPPPNT